MTAQLRALENEDSEGVQQAENGLGDEVLRLLAAKHVDTSGLLSAVHEARALNDGHSPAQTAEAVTKLRAEVHQVMANPALQDSIQVLRTYYRRILSAPSLIEMNDEIYQRSVGFLVNPHLENDAIYVEGLRQLFIRYLQNFLAEERAILNNE